MTVQIDFPADIEQQLQARAAAAGQDVGAFVRQIVSDCLRDEGGEPSAVGAASSDFAKKLDAWTAQHPRLTSPIDDRRESIYAGRGE